MEKPRIGLLASEAFVSPKVGTLLARSPVFAPFSLPERAPAKQVRQTCF